MNYRNRPCTGNTYLYQKWPLKVRVLPIHGQVNFSQQIFLPTLRKLFYWKYSDIVSKCLESGKNARLLVAKSLDFGVNGTKLLFLEDLKNWFWNPQICEQGVLPIHGQAKYTKFWGSNHGCYLYTSVACTRAITVKVNQTIVGTVRKKMKSWRDNDSKTPTGNFCISKEKILSKDEPSTNK